MAALDSLTRQPRDGTSHPGRPFFPPTADLASYSVAPNILKFPRSTSSPTQNPTPTMSKAHTDTWARSALWPHMPVTALAPGRPWATGRGGIFLAAESEGDDAAQESRPVGPTSPLTPLPCGPGRTAWAPPQHWEGEESGALGDSSGYKIWSLWIHPLLFFQYYFFAFSVRVLFCSCVRGGVHLAFPSSGPPTAPRHHKPPPPPPHLSGIVIEPAETAIRVRVFFSIQFVCLGPRNLGSYLQSVFFSFFFFFFFILNGVNRVEKVAVVEFLVLPWTDWSTGEWEFSLVLDFSLGAVFSVIVPVFFVFFFGNKSVWGSLWTEHKYLVLVCETNYPWLYKRETWCVWKKLRVQEFLSEKSKDQAKIISLDHV